MDKLEVMERLEDMQERWRFDFWSYDFSTISAAMNLIENQSDEIECLRGLLKDTGDRVRLIEDNIYIAIANASDFQEPGVEVMRLIDDNIMAIYAAIKEN